MDTLGTRCQCQNTLLALITANHIKWNIGFLPLTQVLVRDNIISVTIATVDVSWYSEVAYNNFLVKYNLSIQINLTKVTLEMCLIFHLLLPVTPRHYKHI